MRVIDLVPESSVVNELPAEELAAIVLQCLNSECEQNSREVPHFHLGNFCNGESDDYKKAGKPECWLALSAAWTHLSAMGMLAIDPRSRNDWYVLTPRGRAVKSREDYDHLKAAALFPKGSLHPAIERVAYQEFLRGDYEIAVLKAFRELEITVRKALNAGNDVLGKDLMAKAFNPTDGAIRDEDELPAEQLALMQLFMGAIGRFKNPPSHREVYFRHPTEAIEAIQFASLLMRIAWDRFTSELGFTDLTAGESS